MGPLNCFLVQDVKIIPGNLKVKSIFNRLHTLNLRKKGNQTSKVCKMKFV